MCTVVVRLEAGAPTRILALRDELVGRAFDDPGDWWPEYPGVVGGRDRVAGGTWCATSAATGVTALVLNSGERRMADAGASSRGVLPLLALQHGAGWQEHVTLTGMASFTLVLTKPAIAWSFDGATLSHRDLANGTQMFTSGGAEDGRAARFLDAFSEADFPGGWFDLVTAQQPADKPDALIVRHEFDGQIFGTVFSQLIEAEPRRVWIRKTRTPSDAATWRERTWAD